MYPYFFETALVEKGKLILENLPFSEGERVDVIILKREEKKDYPLWGKDFEYIDQTEPVALNDWESLK